MDQTKTATDWAEEPALIQLGIYAYLLRDRIRKGWTIQDTMTTPPLVGKRITYNGETLTMIEWSRRLGAEKTNIVSKRIRKGWSVEDAVSVPKSQSRPSIK